MAVRALIVDDEYPAREELRYRLGQFPDVEVVGEAATAREALQLIQALTYDVLFLDIQMPGMTGLELGRALRERGEAPAIVFVTAFETYAVPAFEVQALDYLLKPIDDARLAETVRRLRALQDAPGREPVAPADAAGTRRLPVLTWVMTERDGRQIPIPKDDVVYFLSEEQGVFVQTDTERLPTRFTLQELTERLPSEQFFRCHRGYIVNLHQVREMSPYFNGTYLLRMNDKQHSEVLVSRANVKRLKELFAME